MKTIRRSMFALLAVAMTTFGAAEASAAYKVRISTLAPKNSSWGKVFKIWEKAMKKKSKGKLELEVYYNGVQGQEGSMVGKMKTGQLDGASLTSLGMGKIDKKVMVMTLPFMIDSWKKLDKVRPKMAPDFEKAFEAKGFKVLGWGDVGLVYGFSKGFAIRKPTDLRGKRPMVWRNEPVGPIIFSIIGGVTAVPSGVMEVLPNLRSGAINSISAPALAAEQLQWVPHLDHVSDQPIACATGGMVFTKKALDKMPGDLRTLFFKMQKKVGQNQNSRIRKLDSEAFARIKKRMKLIKVNKKGRDAWEKIVRKTLKRLSQGTYPRPLMEKVAKLAGYTIPK